MIKNDEIKKLFELACAAQNKWFNRDKKQK